MQSVGALYSTHTQQTVKTNDHLSKKAHITIAFLLKCNSSWISSRWMVNK